MTRIKLPPQARRTQFLDCAQALFFSRGYEAATVNDIIEMAGLSKGAFYHYFDSKEALLDALAERVAARVIEDAAPILEDPTLDALARLNAFIAQGAQWKIEQAPLLKAVFQAILRAENVLLNRRILATMGRVTIPVIVDMVREGVREGVFDPVSPTLLAEIFLNLGDGRMTVAVEAISAAERGDLDTATALLETRLQDEAAVLDRLLGVPPGSVRLVEPGFVRAILAVFA
ncbi:MAG: TetR/AcrR family transcriptional regulator [Phenylobacterium sp.]|uniref:TetR/AcrR family transcriptional regulator n=1 Tax=Phenylobacterium sp. TaxID=1871053 RepID=UPI001A3C6395|nr:TetR/AcrR family transcriptional regulator [Phenylobacterium sp.]MBL8771069.1 TetR/AcrR family transcriptional regulator [Phenylobacterium sp.]